MLCYAVFYSCHILFHHIIRMQNVRLQGEKTRTIKTDREPTPTSFAGFIGYATGNESFTYAVQKSVYHNCCYQQQSTLTGCNIRILRETGDHCCYIRSCAIPQASNDCQVTLAYLHVSQLIREKRESMFIRFRQFNTAFNLLF